MIGRYLIYLFILFQVGYASAWAYTTGCSPVNGGTCYSVTAGSYSDFKSAVAAASNGDTIRFPAGSYTVDSSLDISKNLYIVGAKDCSGDTSLDSGTQTIFTGTLTNAIDLSSSGLTDLSNFAIDRQGSGVGFLLVSAGNKRIHHYYTENNGGHVFKVNGNIHNIVFDHFYMYGTYGFSVGGGSSHDGYWTTAGRYLPGDQTTLQGVYIEDGVFNNPSAADPENVDIQGGANYVVRNCTFPYGGNLAIHGADSSERSGGWIEAYSNTFTSPNDKSFIFRGGSQFVFNNANNGGNNNFIKVQYWRSCYGFHAQPMDSSNQTRCTGDGNDLLDQVLDSTGWTCKDQLGVGPNQGRYPSYAWENTWTGGDAGFNVSNLGGCSSPSTNDHIQQGRDYFEDISGATNQITRVTTEPTTCSTQYAAVWYDADNDSVFDDGITGGSPETLYQCDGANYVAFYTPAPYPHPLIAATEGGDTTDPVVTISDPDPKNVTSSSTTLTGSASDANGIDECKWRIGSAPDESNGTSCTGTTSWACAVTGLSEGNNDVYVGCADPSNNWGSDNGTVNYSIPTVHTRIGVGSKPIRLGSGGPLLGTQ